MDTSDITLEIPLTKGYVTLIEGADQDLASLLWHVSTHGYARRNGGPPDYKNVFMHRLILERMLGRQLVKGECVDHINVDKRDNRRSNLRLATKSQNQRNQGLSKKNTSGFKGVAFDKARGKWRAAIKYGAAHKFLGRFDTPELAYEAYCKAALQFYGEFANFG